MIPIAIELMTSFDAPWWQKLLMGLGGVVAASVIVFVIVIVLCDYDEWWERLADKIRSGREK
jgi:hypothetical protein